MSFLSCRPLALGLGALVASAAVQADVELQPQARDDLGIRTEVAQAVEAPHRWPATAQVLDVTPLITALNELHAAERAADVSRREAQRSERLYQDDTNIALKALDAARLQASADEARVRTARAQLLGTWGRGISVMPAAVRTKLVEDVLGGRVSLVRADSLMTLPEDVPPLAGRVSRLDGRDDRPAEWLGILPQATHPTLGGAILLRLTGALPAGELLHATLIETRATRKGFGVPASAIIRWHGSEWIYEEISVGHFVRRAIEAGAVVDGRVLIESDGRGLPKVVTVGARALLAAELGASDAQSGGE